MVPAGEQGEARRMTGVLRSVVGQVGMPEHHVAGLRGKFPAAGGRVVAEHIPRKPLDLHEAAVDMRGMLKKVPVSGVVASRPVNQGPAAGFHVVQVGRRADHERQPASPVGIDMSRLGHFPGLSWIGPPNDRNAVACDEVPPAELVDDRHHGGMVHKGRFGWIVFVPVETARFPGPGRGILKAAVERPPDLPPPCLEGLLVEHVLEYQVAVQLEIGDLLGIEGRRTRHLYSLEIEERVRQSFKPSSTSF